MTERTTEPNEDMELADLLELKRYVAKLWTGDVSHEAIRSAAKILGLELDA